MLYVAPLSSMIYIVTNTKYGRKPCILSRGQLLPEELSHWDLNGRSCAKKSTFTTSKAGLAKCINGR